MGRDEFPENTTQLLSKLNNWRPIGQRPAQQHRQRRPNVPDEDGLNFAQGADEADAAGAQLFISSDNGCEDDDVAVAPPFQGERRNHRRKKKNRSRATGVSEPPSDKGDEAPGVSGDTEHPPPDGGPCVHCGLSDHDLSTCPDITDEQLAEIYIQLQDTDIADKEEGAVLFQQQCVAGWKDVRMSGGLRSS